MVPNGLKASLEGLKCFSPQKEWKLFILARKEYQRNCSALGDGGFLTVYSYFV